jgi:hypothetical protein
MQAVGRWRADSTLARSYEFSERLSNFRAFSERKPAPKKYAAASSDPALHPAFTGGKPADLPVQPLPS